MTKLIDADKLREQIANRADGECYDDFYEGLQAAYNRVLKLIDEAPDLSPIEYSEEFAENIRILLHDKLSGHSEDGSVSWTTLIDDETLNDIVTGIWFYVGKAVVKYPKKELRTSDLSVKEDVDLEEEMGEFWLNNEGYEIAKLEKVARHFYELGKKTRNSMPQTTFYPEPQGEAIIDENGYHFRAVKSKELDEAAEEYERSRFFSSILLPEREVFKAGANWQAQHSLTLEDIERLDALIYAIKNNKTGAFTFTKMSDEKYEEVLKRFNELKKQ